MKKNNKKKNKRPVLALNKVRPDALVSYVDNKVCQAYVHE